jgi:hypothetical protein
VFRLPGDSDLILFYSFLVHSLILRSFIHSLPLSSFLFRSLLLYSLIHSLVLHLLIQSLLGPPGLLPLS